MQPVSLSIIVVIAAENMRRHSAIHTITFERNLRKAISCSLLTFVRECSRGQRACLSKSNRHSIYHFINRFHYSCTVGLECASYNHQPMRRFIWMGAHPVTFSSSIGIEITERVESGFVGREQGKGTNEGLSHPSNGQNGRSRVAVAPHTSRLQV